MGFLSSIFGYILNYLYEIFNNYGIAIIVFSILLRVVLIPITIKQQKSMKKSAKIQTKLAEIQNKYKNNPEKLNQETMQLYKDEKMSPFSGCFSGIIQILILLSVFWLVSQPLTYMIKVETDEDLKNIVKEYKDEINNSENKGTYIEIQVISKIEEDYKNVLDKLNKIENGEELQEEQESIENIENVENLEINENNNDKKIETKEELLARKEKLEKLRINMEFLGLDLSKVPTEDISNIKALIIPILYVVSSFISIRLSTNINNQKKEKEKLISDGSDNKTEPELVEKENDTPDLNEAMADTNKKMAWFMPIMSISTAIVAPLGLALYWLMNNILMIFERVFLNKIIKD